ncbi:MAG: kynurenine formamidase [Planctomycetota bacterium]|nr:kynurenine formamidase [Planctomycetota bacterium]
MLYDITPPISDLLSVWPGDTPPRREVVMDMARGDSVTLSTLHATVHLGAHADAPNHYGRDGADIASRSLDFYLGRCQVIRVKVPRGGVVEVRDLDAEILAPRVLIHTGTFPDPSVFSQDFAALSPDLIDHLYSRGVRLIGIDTPSVDPFSSKTLDAHRAFLRHDMAILEGLVLDTVPEGVYDLIALPLKLVGFDASPVRAVLRSLGHEPSRQGS